MKYLVAPQGLPEDFRARYEFSDLDLTIPQVMVPFFFFYQLPATSASDREAIVQRLQDGLAKTGAQFPIQTGCVYKEVETGRPYVKVTPQHNGILLYAKGVIQISTDLPSHSTFSNANFRPDLIPGPKLLPFDVMYKAVPTEEPLPSCICQVTFIDGGLILGYAMNHLVADMPATELFLRTWTANSRNGSEISPIMLADRSLLNAQDPSISEQRLDEIEHKLATTGHLTTPHTKAGKDGSVLSPDTLESPPNAACAIIAFPAEAARGLKTEVIKALGQDVHISTWDCLTALTWRAVVRAQLQIQPDYERADTTLFHAVGFRGSRISAFPADYFGNAVVQCTSGPTSPAAMLAPDALPTLAMKNRDRILGVNRSLVDDVAQWAGTRGISTGFLWSSRRYGPMDVSFTSWTNVSCYTSYDFGFGLPCAFRVSSLSRQHNCLLPNRMYEDGVERFELYAGFEVKVHELLMKDEEFRKYADRYDVDLGGPADGDFLVEKWFR